MNVIRFQRDSERPIYYANLSSAMDYSGEYVPADLARTLLAELKDAESEARNELVRLKLQGITSGPTWDNWTAKQERWAAAIRKATRGASDR